MAFIHSRISTKPSNVKWYGRTNPGHLAELEEWTVTHPKVLAYKSTEVDNSPDHHRTTTINASREDMDAFLIDLDAFTIAQLREKFNKENNIVTEIVISQV